MSDARYPGLRAQLLRSAASIPANIAEGAGRDTKAQFARYLEIAIGSVQELDYQVLLAKELGAISQEDGADLDDRISEVGRMVGALRKAVMGKKRDGRRQTVDGCETVETEGRHVAPVGDAVSRPTVQRLQLPTAVHRPPSTV